MASITTAEIRAYVAARLEQGAEHATINRELVIPKRAFRLSLQAGKLLHIPYVPMLREENVRSGFFEADEYQAVREALPAPLQTVATFAYLTGWRIRSEVLPLQWAQVDRHAQTIRLEPGSTKNAEGRTLPYGDLPALVTLVEAQWQAHERLKAAGTICPALVPPRRRTDPRLPEGVAPRLHRRRVPDEDPARLPAHGRPHLVRAGVPEKMAMGITGHKTRSVFDRYDIVNEDDLRSALGKLADTTGTKKGQSTGQPRFGA